MSESLRVKNLANKTEFKNADLFPKEDCNIIIPFSPSGYTDYSNNGYVDGQYQINDYLTYKRLWTGNDCFIVTGKDSTSVDSELSSDDQIQVTGQVGDYILGYNTSTNTDAVIESDAAFAEYKKQTTKNYLTFRIDANQKELTENYNYLFYKVPEVTGDVLLRVVSLETEYAGRKKIAYTLTLCSLQQDLEHTGQAVLQNVMPNAPGQGYYDPKIYDSINGSDTDKNDMQYFTEDADHVKIDNHRWLSYDADKAQNDPVKQVVVKLFGNALCCDFALIGRRATKGALGKDYGIPRWIFPINLSQATTPTLYRAQNPEDNFYGCYGFTPTIIMSKSFTEYFKDLFQVGSTGNVQGFMYCPKDYSFSNPTNDDGNLEWTLYGNFDYSSSISTSTTIGQFSVPSTITYTTAGVTGCDQTYTISSVSPNIRQIHDYMWDTFWCLKKVVQIPLKKECTLSFGNIIGSGISTMFGGLGQMAINWKAAAFGLIAGFALFIVGISATMAERITTPNLNEGLMGFMSAPLLDFMTAETQTNSITDTDSEASSKELFFLNYFFGEGSNDYLTWFNVKTMQTSFQADLTDRFMKSDVTASSTYNSNIFTTELIGQSTTEDGNNILSDGSDLLVSGGETLQAMESDDIGFIIDGFNLQSVFSGDVSVEMLNADGDVIWSGIYMTGAKGSGSIRTLNTYKNTSIYGRENIYLSSPKSGPAEVSAVSMSATKGDISVSYSQNYSISYTGTDAKTLPDLYTDNGGSVDGANSSTTTSSDFSFTYEYVYFTYNGSDSPNSVDANASQTFTLTANLYKLTTSKDVSSTFTGEQRICTSNGATTWDDFGNRFNGITLTLNDTDFKSTQSAWTKSTSTDSDGYYYMTATLTNTQTTTASNPIALCTSTQGADCNTGTSFPQSNGVASGIFIKSNATAYNNGLVYDFIGNGTISAKNTYTINATITFKPNGVYFKITSFTGAQTLTITPTLPNSSISLYGGNTSASTITLSEQSVSNIKMDTLMLGRLNYIATKKLWTSSTTYTSKNFQYSTSLTLSKVTFNGV